MINMIEKWMHVRWEKDDKLLHDYCLFSSSPPSHLRKGRHNQYFTPQVGSNIPVIVSPIKNYTTAEPQWLTSPFFRAGNEAVIRTLTGNNTTPTYTFTFSSALPGLPNLAYGIKNYRGINDFIEETIGWVRNSTKSKRSALRLPLSGSRFKYTEWPTSGYLLSRTLQLTPHSPITSIVSTTYPSTTLPEI